MAKRLLFVLAPLAVVLIIVEIAARSYVAALPYHRGFFRTRGTNPAYTTKPWFSTDFLTSAITQPGGHYTPAGTSLILPRDYQDEYFNIHRGVRRTTGSMWTSDLGAPVRLVMIGGSTVYCSEVPDGFTLPSQFQSHLSAEPETRRIIVENYGVTTVHSKQELERLEWEVAQGRIPQVAVFYNGVNDIIQGIYNASPQGTIQATEEGYRHSLRFRMAEHSAAAELVFFGRAGRMPPLHGAGGMPPHLADADRVAELAIETADAYEANMRQAFDLCQKLGIRFFLFLQPNTCSIRSRPLTEHEQSMLDEGFAGIRIAFEAGYPLLQDRVRNLQASGIQAFDISDCLDANREPVFLDFCHIESDGNGIVAEAIHDRIAADLVGIVREWK